MATTTGRGRRAGWSTQANDVVDRVFVYGTFRLGEPARAMIDGYVESHEPASITGRIYAFAEGWPGMVEDDDAVVVGELLWLQELAAALPLLDAYEGEEFRRVLRLARRADGASMYAWCYMLADAATAATGALIPHGDWTRWRRERA